AMDHAVGSRAAAGGPGAALTPGRAGQITRCDASKSFSSAGLAKSKNECYSCALAQMAELVDALVSGTSAERRGGSSPLLGTTFQPAHPMCRKKWRSRNRNKATAEPTQGLRFFIATMPAFIGE